MKISNLFLASCIASSLISFAQNPNANVNAQWRINGNSAATTDFIGTTNNQPLIFKTNSLERLQIDAQGKLLFNSGQEMIINQSGLIRQVNTNPISAYMIKVGGSGHFDGEVNTRQLFVQEYITYMKSLKGPSINVDSIRMDSTRGIYGQTKIFGNVQIKQNLQVDGDITANGSMLAKQGFKFDATNGLQYAAATTTSGAVFRLGATYSGGGANTDPSEPLLCYQPTTNAWFDMQGGFISRSYPNNGNQVAGSLTMSSAPWDGSGIIEVGGHKGPGDISNGLLINYFCGRNTYINTNIGNANGCGIVSMGKQVEIGIPNSDATVNLNIKSRAGIQRSIQVLDINDKINFLVKPNGYVYAREINVMPTTITFPDYVFAKNYKLMPLAEVENYVTANKHLPNIPSAKEVETNGINLADLQIKQMEKIEELYLHLIELKKENEALKTRIESLEKK
jgi:cytoskeletal protein CcmA (bactofilin family)